MGNLFFKLGRSVGYAAIPAIRKTRSAWKSLTGNGSESIGAQTEFGRALASEMRLKVRLSNDPEARNLVRPVIERMAGCLRNRDRTFHVDILADPNPTAVALPGGFIFLSMGLLDFCERKPDCLAFFIGHEMGHIVRGHALERVLTRIGTEGLSAILSRGLLNPILRDVGMKWLETPHSNEAELEADEFGVRVAWSAGYDPQAPVQALERIAALRQASSLPGDFFRSHPPEAERIAHVKTIWKSIPAEGNPSSVSAGAAQSGS